MRSWLKGVPLGYFALVMATGIIAVACEQQALRQPAEVLYIVAAIAYVVLWVLLVLRIAGFPRAVAADLTHHATGFTFLTVVAATNVLGSASGIVHGWWGLAWALWWVSLPLVAVGVYVPLISVILRRDAPGLQEGINGTWFLLAVAIESVAVLAGLLLARHPDDLLAFVTLAAFAVGLLLYVVVMTLVFLRWVFFRLDPTEVHPPAWIAAGAVAITTLAGSNLLAAAPQVARLDHLAAIVEGVMILAWGTATFWFPVMIAIGVWRHVACRVPLTYDPSVWSMVFPLGMYAAATWHMLDVEGVAHLDATPQVALAIAAAAWLAAAAGLVHRWWSSWRNSAIGQHRRRAS